MNRMKMGRIRKKEKERVKNTVITLQIYKYWRQ
jgi:hypothetical protein